MGACSFVLELEIWSSCFLLASGCVPLQGMTCTAVAAEILLFAHPHRMDGSASCGAAPHAL